MAMFGTSIRSLDDLFVHTLRTTYYAENRIVAALEAMAEKATLPELKAAFDRHRAESQVQAQRLERLFALHDQEPKEMTCPAFDGIRKANDATAADSEPGPVLDAALAGGARLVEHYEIAQYGKLIAWAQALGRDEDRAILAETLEEERAADDRLVRLAETSLDPAAA